MRRTVARSDTWNDDFIAFNRRRDLYSPSGDPRWRGGQFYEPRQNGQYYYQRQPGWR